MANLRARRKEDRRGPRRRRATDPHRAAQAPRQTDNWFPRFAGAAFEGLVIHENGVILDANQVAAEAIGYTRSELIGRHAREFVAPESQDSLQQALTCPSDAPIEAVCIRKDGSTFPVELRGRPISYDGRTARVASIRDTTDRKRAEEALLESEAKYRQIFENIRDVYYQADAQGMITDISPSVERYGLTREQLIGRSVLDIYANPEDRAAHLQALAEHGEVVDYELRMRTPDGREGYVSESARVLRGDDGSIIGYEGVLRNISERKRAEEALRESERKYRRIFEDIRDVVYHIDTNSIIVDVSPSVQRYGYSRDELIGTRAEDVFLDPEDHTARLKVVLEQGELLDQEVRIRTGDGEVRYASLTAHLIHGQDGAVIGVGGALRDITERKRAEAALRESEERFRKLSDAALEGICIHDGHEVLAANQAFATMGGFEVSDVVGMDPLDLAAPESREFVRQVIATGYEEPYESMSVKKDGTTYPIEGRAKAMFYQGRKVRVAAVRDITERKRAEEALQRAREELEDRVERRMQQGINYGLTFRELTVLHLVAAGKSDKEIGVTLGISPLTARKHVEHILDKMGSTSRTEASVRALREGLLGSPEPQQLELRPP